MNTAYIAAEMSSSSDIGTSSDGMQTEDEEEGIVTPPSTQQNVQQEERAVYLPARIPARTEVRFVVHVSGLSAGGPLKPGYITHDAISLKGHIFRSQFYITPSELNTPLSPAFCRSLTHSTCMCMYSYSVYASLVARPFLQNYAHAVVACARGREGSGTWYRATCIP